MDLWLLWGLYFLETLLALWLLWDLWPDVTWFLSSRTPVDLGGPGAYHLALARENRLATNWAQVMVQSEPRCGSTWLAGASP